jgi:DNA helicase-2/ATP-dependent DNA helicase PcrA
MMPQRRAIDFEQDLNAQQLRVATAGAGPMLVLAGAGSGKTRTLTYRVAHLVAQGIDPHRILLLTFTNKASREMLFRVAALVPCDVQSIWGGTFHHVGNRILRVHAARIGIDENYTIMDRQDSLSLLQDCLADLGYSKKDELLPQGAVLSAILSLACNTRTSLEEILFARYPFFLDQLDAVEKAGRRYSEKKRELHLLDFDDLLHLWLRLLEEQASVRQFYARRFEHLLVDEYQDTNKLQADIIDLLAGEHRNIMAVGDDSQSIYAFRGAHYANIMEFPRRYPEASIHKLEYNYRSTPEILTLANRCIAGNRNQYRKELRPVRPSGSRPVLVLPGTLYRQAQFVAGTIESLLGGGTPAEEIAVLYRAHYHSMELQMELSRRGISFDVRSGIRFFEQAHIKDIIAYVRLMLNPFDETAWKRVLELLPGIGPKTSRKLCARFAATDNPCAACLDAETARTVPKNARASWGRVQSIFGSLLALGGDAPPAAMLKAALNGGYRDFLRIRYPDAQARGDDIEQFIEFAWHYTAAADFLSEMALMTGSDSDPAGPLREQPASIKLSTIHQAKGLEWTVVFILCLAEGRFPNPANFEGSEDEEEERRLFYVAVTRAGEHLYLCAPDCVTDRNGCTTPLKLSRFVRELGEENYETYACMYAGGGY